MVNDPHRSAPDPLAALREIFLAGVREVDPRGLIRRNLSLRGETLSARGAEGHAAIDLGRLRGIWVIGAGKAGAPMAAAVEELLGERIAGGLVVVKRGHTDPGSGPSPKRIELVEAGHPVPDTAGLEAARRLEALAGQAAQAGPSALVINLISGGGSALLPAPLDYGTAAVRGHVSLEDLQRTTEVLLACGASIQEINCMRKHLSRLKGGRLARLLYPARSLNLILSDVVGDRLDVVASGLTVADPTTYRDALDIVGHYGIGEKLPTRVLEALNRGARGELEDTPKPGDPAFEGVWNVLLGTNYTGLAAAAARAAELGYRPVILSSRITGEAAEVARVLAAVALEQASREVLGSNPVCLLAGGETTVTIRGGGLGGRNQELALAYLLELSRAGEAAERVFFLSAATDGNDGPTDAAGAYASAGLLRRAGELGLDPAGFLRRNDSYRFYEALGGYLRTGPTNTNVCDFMLALVQPLRDRDGRTGPQAGQRRTRPTQGSTQEVFGYTAQ